MNNLSQKTAIAAFLCFLAVFTLINCMPPVDIDEFEKEVADQEKVILTDDSLGTAGNTMITGLTAGRYYMIEEFNESGAKVNSRYVAAGGTRTATFTSIGKLSGTAITGLENDTRYRVTAAAAITGTIKYDEGTVTPGSANKDATATADGVTLKAPATGNLYMDISALIALLPAASGSYQVLNKSTNMQITPPSGIIQLGAPNTTTDYVIADILSGEPVKLHYLTVKINPASVPISVTINATIANDDIGEKITDGTLTLSATTITISLENLIANQIIDITFDNFTPSSIEWYHNGNSIVSPAYSAFITAGGDLNINGDPIIILRGKHNFTVFVKVGEITYSSSFVLFVDP